MRREILPGPQEELPPLEPPAQLAVLVMPLRPPREDGVHLVEAPLLLEMNPAPVVMKPGARQQSRQRRRAIRREREPFEEFEIEVHRDSA